MLFMESVCIENTIVKRAAEEHRVFESRARVSIMSLLMVNASMDFTMLRNQLGLTDGNLAAHMAVLSKAGYVRARKAFVGRKPRTTYVATEGGRRAFSGYLDSLEELLKRFRGKVARP
jgi:DNA-binding MarR family transcriptional regulator